MRKFAYIIVALIAGAGMQARAQQIAQFSQYMFNEYVFNPAVAGTYDYYQIRTNHRFQWVGITDPPITNAISFYGPHSRLNMGFGGTISTDVTGPTSRTNVSGSYAYNIALNRDMRISMGLNFGILQYKIDGTKLTPEDPSDQVLQGIVDVRYAPDAGLGAYLYADNFYAGFSVLQILNNKLKVFDEQTGLNKLQTHYYLLGGYRYDLNRDWRLEPNALVKYASPAQFSFELSVKAVWTNMVWAAAGYRFKEAATVMVGYNYEDKFYFGYAYDIGITDLRNYNSGSHEIMIGYRFNDIK